MRTTLTLDPDVAEELKRLRRSQGRKWKTLVNEVLRLGLRARDDGEPPRGGKPFKTRSVSLGGARIPLDNVAEVLALAEGEHYK
jgi:BrnA antitoxin of type II toxin-antitoxin system